ncbi:mobile mystery protein B [Vibrio cholerae]|uniref:mobile mystery protein B n=1 Tax=Vibrio cholerae TaxID=666 RepID=UPI0011D9E360|nr:mobile mystery protein B [Vibrio cholerae]TXX54750.1 mobile mystery protein B [Vibrio cholerae]GIB82249.1 mobile mystery protein B [Vibrio cholerae]
MNIFDEPNGATPLGPDERAGLLMGHVETRDELNELENANILQGLGWLGALSDKTADDLLTMEFVEELHRRMFGEIWGWAGTYRIRELNIGCDPFQIRPKLYNLLEDIKCWIEFEHYDSLELSARIQHQLVKIHPFPNGNGRHSRILTDCIRVMLLNKPPINWSEGCLDNQTEERHQYISSLQKADQGDYEPLINYLRLRGNDE